MAMGLQIEKILEDLHYDDLRMFAKFQRSFGESFRSGNAGAKHCGTDLLGRNQHVH